MNLRGVADVTNLQKYGKDYIEYKYRFCQRKTHFCEDCHKRQYNVDYVSEYSKDRLYKFDKKSYEVGCKLSI